ncbi:serine protease [Rhodovulum kholense]|uniref:Putative peptidoglycan binding protein n=1 Tax=Rhodovulum kholense TaxID=453584 RepID=A0A8E2VN77_9RHOB|nr:serine protease [Rhodovulum kholense]PTW51322.1 putative peptidoglycan binding protein [Rhodovulum kholense]
MRIFATIAFVLLAALPAAAQDRAWVQVEAHPTLREAEERARAYAAILPDVGAYRLNSGWYTIAVGPFPSAEAELARFKAGGLVPADTFIADGTNYERRVWPVGAEAGTPSTEAPVTAPPATDAAAAPAPAADPAPEMAAAAEPEPVAVPELPDETPYEARQSEARLDTQGRMEIQTALKWEGFYTSTIDAAFGPGTRNAMASWQAAKGYEATGVLTSRQRAELVGGYQAQIARLGMTPVDEPEAGIRIEMPMGLVQFDRYEPPFVHYASRGDSGVKALLISERGDQSTLYGLYDIMQTLEIVPLEGARERNSQSFTLTGRNDRLESYSYAVLTGGMIKGFSLIWTPTEDSRLMQRAVAMMKDSLESVPNVALDETLGEATPEQRADMLSGLDVRKPDATHSGFFVDPKGTVLTTTNGLDACRRITIGPELEMRLTATDPAQGLALLTPTRTLAPIGFAEFAPGVPRLRSDVAVAGFSYGEVLDLPVLTFGVLADLKGLGGEEAVDRLELDALPGDTGGPILDASGAVLGVLLAPAEGARQLPDSVRYAADAAAVGAFLSANGVDPRAAAGTGALPPAVLSRRAADMTVPVSCWN